MSSILDALKKVEEEKNAIQQSAEIDFRGELADPELIVSGRYNSKHSSSRTLFIGGISFVTVLCVLSVGVSFYLFMKAGASNPPSPITNPPKQVASVSHPPGSGAVPETPPAPVSAPPATPKSDSITPPGTATPVSVPSSQTPVQNQAPVAPKTDPVPVLQQPVVAPPLPPAQVAPVASQPEVAPPAPAPSVPQISESAPPIANSRPPDKPASVEPVVQPKATVNVAPEPAPSPVVETPQPTLEPAKSTPPVQLASRDRIPEAATTRPRAETGPSERAAPLDKPTQSPKPAERVDMKLLPVISEDDKTRCNLEGLQINLVRAPDERRPVASAVINLKTVFVGHRIQGSDAKLIDVSNEGIAIEIVGSGEKFFVPY